MEIDKILKRTLLAIFIFFIVGIIAVGVVFGINILPVDVSDNTPREFVVENGMGQNAIADKLEKEGIIKSAFFFKIFIKTTEPEDFKAGKHILAKNMSVDEIIGKLVSGETIKQDVVKITFVEGKRFPYYVTKIAENFDFDEESIYNLTGSDEFLSKIIEKYWFIDEHIKNKDLYYPLEGYLFPDTYEFKKDSTASEVFYKLLDEMGKKLNTYEEEIKASKYSVHELITLASLVELEGGLPEDRKMLSGVFYNRLNSGWSLGSDVTTYYAARKELTEPIYQSELNACNAYNTRGNCVKGLPVGPICSPSISSIIAAIEPSESTYFYFVADKNKKIYFGETNGDHHKNINDLKKNNLWPE